MAFINVVNSFPKVIPSYAETVSATDKSSFRPDAEQVRAMKFNPLGESTTPLYDYADGKVPDDDPISDVILAIRSGRLDRADVDQIKKSLLDHAKFDAEASHASEIVKAMDKALGIGSAADSSAQK